MHSPKEGAVPVNGALIGAAVALIAWVVLAFVVAWPSGWAHTPLAIAVVLIVKGIVDADARSSG